jgi:hypothetical protein
MVLTDAERGRGCPPPQGIGRAAGSDPAVSGFEGVAITGMRGGAEGDRRVRRVRFSDEAGCPYQQALMEEREREIEAVHGQTLLVNEAQRDLADIVAQQQVSPRVISPPPSLSADRKSLVFAGHRG